MNASNSALIRPEHAATAEVLDLPLPSARRREQPLPSPAEL
ncbi:3-deoxy-7-phosphoheptulonate synthase, partial [Pseudomonas sp. ATCC 13867]